MLEEIKQQKITAQEEQAQAGLLATALEEVRATDAVQRPPGQHARLASAAAENQRLRTTIQQAEENNQRLERECQLQTQQAYEHHQNAANNEQWSYRVQEEASRYHLQCEKHIETMKQEVASHQRHAAQRGRATPPHSLSASRRCTSCVHKAVLPQLPSPEIVY